MKLFVGTIVEAELVEAFFGSVIIAVFVKAAAFVKVPVSATLPFEA